MSLPVIVIGAGGHAKVLIEILKLKSVKAIGITVPEFKPGEVFQDIAVIGNDNVVFQYPSDKVLLVNGLGSISFNEKRKKIFELYKENGYQFATVVHPSVVIASDVTISEGVQIMAGAIIQPGSYIGQNTIINTKVSVDHDCRIGNNVHIAPGSTLSGGVQIGDDVHIGTGATVIQGINISQGCFVGAGSLVLKDVPTGKKVLGVPAREVSS